MPKEVEQKLKREAKKRGLTGDAYVYGTMQKLGLLGKAVKKGRKK